MNKFLLCIAIFMAFYFTAQAQNTPFIDTLPWAPEGATWVYSNSHKMTIKYTHDSIVEGQDVKVFKFYAQRNDSSFYPVPRPYITFEGEEYLYNSNDSVFFYDQGLEAFVLLYDFNAQEGDSWSYNTSYLDCLSDTTINNNSFNSSIEYSTVLVNNTTQYQTLKSTDISDGFSTIIPNIGNLAWFLPLYNVSYCSEYTLKYLYSPASSLSCYIDNTRGRIITGNPPYNGQKDSICTATINMVNDFIVSVEKPALADNKNDKFSIYPNPAHSTLNIYSNGISFEEIIIYDAIGRLVIRDKSRNENINIQELQSGLYIINIIDEYKQVSAFKFVKE